MTGAHHGYFDVGSPHDDRVLEDINARRPDILLVGMGTPKQEEWVQEHMERVDVDVFWTGGALMDNVTGRIPRAPGWLAQADRRCTEVKQGTKSMPWYPTTGSRTADPSVNGCRGSGSGSGSPTRSGCGARCAPITPWSA